MEEQKLLEFQIFLLESSISTMRTLRTEGIDLTTAIVHAELILLELEKQAGFHCVSPIMNGSATESVFCGTHEDCQKYISNWIEEHPEDKGKLIISPLTPTQQ